MEEEYIKAYELLKQLHDRKPPTVDEVLRYLHTKYSIEKEII